MIISDFSRHLCKIHDNRWKCEELWNNSEQRLLSLSRQPGSIDGHCAIYTEPSMDSKNPDVGKYFAITSVYFLHKCDIDKRLAWYSHL